MSEDFSSENKSTIAFKKLFNKAHTSPNKALGNELIASNVSIADSTIFAEALPVDPVASPGTVVEKVTFNLVEDNTAAGHAWKLQFPSDYSGSLEGKASQFIHQYLGAVQLVPPTYGLSYTAKVKDSSGNELSFGDGAFFIDYYAGIFFQKEANQQAPHTVEAFVYTGKMLNQVVSDIQSSVENSQDSLIAGSGISISGSTISAEVTAASLQALSTAISQLPNSIQLLDDVDVTAASLTNGQYLKWEDYQWVAGNASDFTSGVSTINGESGFVDLTTTDIPEGVNKYVTEANITAITFSSLLNASVSGSSSQWAEGIALSLDGAVTGAATLDGSQNLTITTAFVDNIATQDYADSAATAVKNELIGSSTLTSSLNTFKKIADFITTEEEAVDILQAAIVNKVENSTIINAGSGIVTAGSLGSGATVSLGTISGLPTGQVGSSTQVPVITLDTHGRVTALSTTTVNNFDGQYSSLTGAPTLSNYATAASLTDLSTLVNSRQNITTIGSGLSLDEQGSLTANVTTIDGYVTAPSFSALEAVVDARSNIQNISGDLTLTGTTLSTNFDISDYVTATSFSGLQSTVNSRENITGLSSDFTLNSGTLALVGDYATATSLSALSGRVGTLENAGYLTSASSLDSSNLDENSFSIGSQSVSLGGSITAASLSDILKEEMNADLGFDALSTRVGTLENANYLTAASSLSAGKVVGNISGQAGSVASLSGHSITIADQSVSLSGGSIAATTLSTALSDSMRTELGIDALATANSLSAVETTVNARQHILSISNGLTLSSGGSLSTSFDISDYLTATSITDSLGLKQDKLTFPTEGPLTVSGSTVSFNSSSFLTSANLDGYLTEHPTITAATLNLVNTGRTYIQSITLDGNGHVTGVSTATEDVENTDTTYSNGSGLSLSGTVFDIANTVSATTLNNPAKTVNLSFNEYGLITAASLQDIEVQISQVDLLQGALDAKQPALSFGISNDDVVEIDGSPTAGQFAKFTTAGITGHTLTSSDIGLGNVENQALSSWAGSSSLTTLGTISSGTWTATPIVDNYISSAATWNAKQDALTFGIANSNALQVHGAATLNDYAKFTASGLLGRSTDEVRTDLALNLVENTALSTWTGSSSISTLGTVNSGVWNASTISSGKIASGITAGDVVKVSSTATSGQFAKFTTTGLESVALAKSDVGLTNVEDQALSSWTGSSTITSLGTISSGAWTATPIADEYIASASTWDDAVTNIGTLASLTTDVKTNLVVAINELETNNNATQSDLDTLEALVGPTELLTTATTITNAINELDGQIDTVEASIGLSGSGAYVTRSGSNYLDTATSVVQEATLLDTQVAANKADITILQTRDGGLLMETSGSGVYMPDTIMLSTHAGPFRLDMADMIANSGNTDYIFYAGKSTQLQDRHFTVDTTDGSIVFTGTTL